MSYIIFPLETNDDSEITCIICGKRKCEYSIDLFGPDCRSVAGIHHKCASWHQSRSRWYIENKDEREITLDNYDRPKVEEPSGCWCFY